jgi:hypothetical protein
VRKYPNYLPTGKYLFSVLSAVLLLAFPSCRKAAYRTDIAGMELEVVIHRFEQDLFAVDFDSIGAAVPGFYARYGEFFDLFNHRIINIGSARQVTYPDYLRSFLTDYLNHQVFKEVMKVFPDLGWLEQRLSDAFKRYIRHFPDRDVPEIYSFVSRFNQSIVTAENILGIGLDNYLGTDCEFYPRLGLHRYQISRMHPGKIASDCMMGWAMSEFEYNDSVDNVLSNMIYHGKMACFTKWMLPGEADSVIMGFSAGQMNFCRNNEARMWEYLVENKSLFETDRLSIQKFTGSGPFTRDFTRESPARAAVWLGWCIVEDYLRRNPEVTLEDLMTDDDYQKILTLSRYDP